MVKLEVDKRVPHIQIQESQRKGFAVGRDFGLSHLHGFEVQNVEIGLHNCYCVYIYGESNINTGCQLSDGRVPESDIRKNTNIDVLRCLVHK